MKILVVEDNTKIAASLKKGLEDEGYAVDVATDGAEGLELGLEESRGYDVAILDWMLPKMEGVEVCRRWRRRGLRFPVLILTAKDMIVDRITGLDAGADDYLPKPFVFDELLARLRALLRRPPLAGTTAYRIDDFAIDPETHTAQVLGTELPLTLKEFRLLELFLRNRGRVLTRENIVSNLWGFDFDGGSNVVDVHVKNLRKKVEAVRKKAGIEDEVVETVRGLGYRFPT
jgi:two-component system OmpR family response regulator